MHGMYQTSNFEFVFTCSVGATQNIPKLYIKLNCMLCVIVYYVNIYIYIIFYYYVLRIFVYVFFYVRLHAKASFAWFLHQGSLFGKKIGKTKSLLHCVLPKVFESHLCSQYLCPAVRIRSRSVELSLSMFEASKTARIQQYNWQICTFCLWKC